MAIPSIPINVVLQTANAQNFLSWSIVSGATSYSVQRSVDGVNFTTVGTPAVNQYLDTSVVVGTNYYYQVASALSSGGQAVATLTFSGQPTATNTVSIANVTFTAVSSGATGNQFNIGATFALTMTNLSAIIATTLANIVIPSINGSVLSLTAFLSGPEGNGLQLSNGLTNVTSSPFSNGTTPVISGYNTSYPTNVVPCLPGQINLGMIRYQAQLRADKLNSQFLTTDEWNININQSMFELFDILTTKYGEDFFVASPYTISTTGAKNYALPDGSVNFAVGGITPPAVYKMIGVDCGVAVGNNAWVTLPRYNWIDRNRFIYPQLQANALGVFNLSYRQMGNQLYFIPNPSAGQYIQIWYVPVMTMLLQDTDMLSFSISGWSEYVIVDAAIKALMKEESFDHANALKMDKAALLERIEVTAANRDVGQPNTISDTKGNTGFYDGGGFGGVGHGMGGWLIALFPRNAIYNVGNHLLGHPILFSQSSLGYFFTAVSFFYLIYKYPREFCGGIRFSRACHFFSSSISSFANHIRMVLGLGAKK